MRMTIDKKTIILALSLITAGFMGYMIGDFAKKMIEEKEDYDATE